MPAPSTTLAPRDASTADCSSPRRVSGCRRWPAQGQPVHSLDHGWDRGAARQPRRLVTTQAEKGEAFRALHGGAPFLIPNPWDAGSARVLQALGFCALATTSSGFAFTLGR